MTKLPSGSVSSPSIASGAVERRSAADAQLHPLDLELERDARRLQGCCALMKHYGIGAKVATAILAALGDTRRFSSSRQAVRFAGLDVTVHQSDVRRRGGHLSRQGSPVLRWTVFEAAQTSARPASPDHQSLRRAQAATRRQPRRADDRARCFSAPITPCGRSATTRSRPPDDVLARIHHSDHRRGQLPRTAAAALTSRCSALEDWSGRTALRDIPSTIMSPSPCPGSSTEIRLGARARPTTDRPRAR